MSGIHDVKKAMRKAVAAKFKETPDEVLMEESGRVCDRVLELEVVRQARGVCVYLSMPKELQTQSLLEALFAERYPAGAPGLEAYEADAEQRLVCVPKVTGRDRRDLVMVPILGGFEEIAAFPKNRWNIPEPVVDPDMDRDAVLARLAPLLEVVILPGVAFDRRCNRLGHGKGYYDTFLQGLAAAREAQGLPPPLTVAVGVGLQLVDAVPTEEHDQRLDAVVLPDEVILGSDRVH